MLRKPSLHKSIFVLIMLLFPAIFLSFHPVKGFSGRAQRHYEIPCKECHILISGLDIKGGPLTELDNRCRICHTGAFTDNDRITLGFHQKRNKSCLDCHSFHSPELITVKNKAFRFIYNNGVAKKTCYVCHNGTGTPKKLSGPHKKAADIFHVDFGANDVNTISKKCRSCHSDGFDNYGLCDKDCIGCHNLTSKSRNTLALVSGKD